MQENKDKTTYEDWGITIPYGRLKGQVKTTCPNCRDNRGNPKDRSLSVNLNEGVWHCHHCDWTGHLPDPSRQRLASPVTKEYRVPPPAPLTDIDRNVVKWFFEKRGISEATLKAARITTAQENFGGTMRTAIQFNYYYEGELVNVKSRSGKKEFRLCAGARLVPYNIDSIQEADVIHWTEGEIDTLSLIEVGITNVISVPNGAQGLTWMDEIYDGWLEDKTHILCLDTDAKGKELKDELIRRLGAENCSVVEWDEGCKDANEELVKYGSHKLLDCIKGANEVPVEGVFTVYDYEPELDRLWNRGLEPGLALGLGNFDKLLTLETKRLMVVTGTPGSGKSVFVESMAVRMNVLHGWRAAFFSPEAMPLSYWASRIIEQLTGRRFGSEKLDALNYSAAKAYMAENFYSIMPETYTVDNILAKAKYLVRRHGIRLLVIDPWNRMDHNAPSSMSETNYIAGVLKKLCNFAQHHDVMVVLVAHPRKIDPTRNPDGVPGPYDINGSANFFNMTDFGITIHRNRDDEYSRVLARVWKVKFRHLGETGDSWFRYNLGNGRYCPIEHDHPEQVVYDNDNYIGKPITLDTINPAPAPAENLQKPFSWRDDEEETFTPPSPVPSASPLGMNVDIFGNTQDDLPF